MIFISLKFLYGIFWSHSLQYSNPILSIYVPFPSYSSLYSIFVQNPTEYNIAVHILLNALPFPGVWSTY